MPVGLDQAGLPVLPQAFQSGKVPNSRGLWWPVATSTWDLVRDLGRAPPWSLEAEKAEPMELRHHWQCSGGWIQDVLSEAFQFQSGI